MIKTHLLHRLQSIDSQIDKIQLRQKEIINLINNKSKVQQASDTLNIHLSNQEKASRALSDIENVVRSIKMKLETNENSLYSGRVKNPKELQDLQTENASLKRRIESIENDQLEAMFQLEACQKEVTIAKENLAITESKDMEEKAGLYGEQTKLQKSLENLEKERLAISCSIEPEHLNIYQSLRDKKRGLAVVIIDDNTCTACGSTLRPAEIQAARSMEQMTYCSSCGRILFAG